MTKFDIVEKLAKQLNCDYNQAFDIVYLPEVIYDENDIDNSL